jgi:signal transduction histidine kinase
VKKHANIKQAAVKVKESEEYIVIHVIDKGRGFDKVQVESRREQTGGFGLFSIQERINLLGGYVEVNSQPNVGTHVTVYVPAHPALQQA